MSNLAVVYWSETGNTEQMAHIIAEAASKAGASVTEIAAADFSESDVEKYDAIAFGCPAMGAEVLEEAEFQPMWDSVKSSLGSKKVGLFGSWGWGGGAWMDDWKDDAAANGVNVAAVALAEYAPDAASEAECVALAEALV